MSDDEEGQMPNGGRRIRANGIIGGAAMEMKKQGGFELKLWALVALIFLAPCSLYTASLALRWAAPHSDDLSSNVAADLDILDVDERGKMVKLMWDTYKHNNNARLSSFWRDAFGAAYQELTCETKTVRDEAFLEIAKMSFRSRGLHDSATRMQASPVTRKKKHREESSHVIDDDHRFLYVT